MTFAAIPRFTEVEQDTDMDTDMADTATEPGENMTDDEEYEDFEMDAESFALVDEIIQVFDDFLWEHNGKIENTEQQPDDWSNPAMIYGSQRDDLVCQIFERLQEWGIV